MCYIWRAESCPVAANTVYRKEPVNIEIDVKKDNVYMVGVPSKNGIEVWKQFKKKADGNRDAI